MNHASVIEQFYESFRKHQAEDMVRWYDDGVIFSDPAFGTLMGEDARNMWRMLLERSKGELKISYRNIRAGESGGSAEWSAEYVFSQTGRKVVNEISAQFEIANGKIIRHADHFNLWKWSRQALGWKGYLLGWTPFMRAGIQHQARQLLKSYSRKRK